MDFMKVFDQTVREIKREVNLKVLKVPEIEQKVLDATDNEPWGPHGTALAEIAQATKKFTECQMVMNVLWMRLAETGKDWRYVYKALTVIEYLVANGSERAVDDIIEHTFQISSLTGFEYVEPNGKDMGINVRKKAENIVTLLNNKDKIQEVRNKAAANRDKYVGLSSTGISRKFGSASYFQSSSKYGGFSGSYDSDNYRAKDEDSFGDEKFEKYVPKSHSVERKTEYGSKDEDHPSHDAAKMSSDQYNAVSQKVSSAPINNHVGQDDDDFDPRGTSAKPAAGTSQQVDLLGDLLDAPTLVPSDTTNNKSVDVDLFVDAAPSLASEAAVADNKLADVDLFAEADFVSAAPQAEAGQSSQNQPSIDLFASQDAPAPAVSSTIDFFAAPDPVTQPETKSSSTQTSSVNSADPFAAVPLNTFDGSDLFGAFSSNTDSSSDPTGNPISSGSTNESNSKSSSESKAPPKKDSFQVKSGIWADSLSRGLIDLNISAPKKVNLADVGIVGGLTDMSEEKPKGPTTSYYMGRAMGSGSSLGRTSSFSPSTGASDNDDFSSFSNQPYQFGAFQK